MRKIMSPTSVRFPKEMQAWLKVRASERNHPVSQEIIQLLQPIMQIEPLQVFVHECQSPAGLFFTASVGKYGDDFYEGDSRDAAFSAAQAKAKELGLSAKSIRLNTENFNQ